MQIMILRFILVFNIISIQVAYSEDTVSMMEFNKVKKVLALLQSQLATHKTRLNGIDGTFTGFIGMIVPFSGAENSIPNNWRRCNGQSLNKENFAKLYSIIASTHGGDGSTFNLPNLDGHFIRGEQGTDKGKIPVVAGGTDSSAHTHGTDDQLVNKNTSHNHIWYNHSHSEEPAFTYDHSGARDNLRVAGKLNANELSPGTYRLSTETSGQFYTNKHAYANDFFKHSHSVNENTSNTDNRPTHMNLIYIMKVK
ncbi:phage tail protein [Bacteriovoracaceae bacterium]|nr:phage tail protein [Bacteriovoracaceae bacterium]